MPLNLCSKTMKIVLFCLFFLAIIVQATNIDTISVLLVGRHNSGKSSLINQLCQKKVVDINSKFSDIQKYDFNPVSDYEINYRIKFYDTPGLYYNEMMTYDVLNKIGQITEIDVIIICIDLSEKLHDDTDIFKLLKTTFGAYIIKNTIIVFTKGDIVTTNTLIAKKRYDAINTKKMSYLIADNTKLANYKILHAIIETGRYAWQKQVPVPYNLNGCYTSCEMPKVILYYYQGYEKPNINYKVLTTEELVEWQKIKNYIKYNMTYIAVEVYECKAKFSEDFNYCNREKPVVSVRQKNVKDNVIISKIIFEDVIKMINQHI